MRLHGEKDKRKAVENGGFSDWLEAYEEDPARGEACSDSSDPFSAW